MILNIQNETSQLKSVVLGKPYLEKDISITSIYDAKSYVSVKENVYPLIKNIKREMSLFENVLKKYNIEIYRPKYQEGCNLIFSRDVSFVIDDYIIISRMTKYREREQDSYIELYKKIPYNKIINLPPAACIEGGDVILYNDIIFVGVYKGKDFDQIKTARTNLCSLSYLKDLFPRKTIIPLELKKDDYNPHKGCLHLDCAFMPVNNNKAILNKEAFKSKRDYHLILDIFGDKNIFHLTNNESFNLQTNLLSISPNVVISDVNFSRLNNYLKEELGMIVETVPYSEISKTGGLFRCSILPLERLDK